MYQKKDNRKKNSTAFTVSVLLHVLLGLYITFYAVKEVIQEKQENFVSVKHVRPPGRRRMSKPRNQMRQFKQTRMAKAIAIKTQKPLTTAVNLPVSTTSSFTLTASQLPSGGLFAGSLGDSMKGLMSDFQPAKVETSIPVTTSSQSTSLTMMASMDMGSLGSSISNFEPDSIAMGPVEFSNSSESIDLYIKKIHEKIRRSQRFGKSANVSKGGTIDVQFVIDRNGNLILLTVDQTSGSETLDRLALGVVQSASPFAKLPDDYKNNELSLILPVIFQVKDN
jgi:TonB family protein